MPLRSTAMAPSFSVWLYLLWQRKNACKYKWNPFSLNYYKGIHLFLSCSLLFCLTMFYTLMFGTKCSEEIPASRHVGMLRFTLISMQTHLEGKNWYTVLAFTIFRLQWFAVHIYLPTFFYILFHTSWLVMKWIFFLNLASPILGSFHWNCDWWLDLDGHILYILIL